jgi:glutathione S-transferase
MLRLHAAPDNASLVVRIALLAAGLPFATVPVDRSADGHKAPAFLALNPAGRVPALETDAGPLFETAAILLWLVDRFPGRGLGPGPGGPLRGAFLSWLFYLSNTPHADLRHLFYPDRHAGPEGHAGHRARTVARLVEAFGLVDADIALRPSLWEPPGVLGLYAAVMARWAVLYPVGAPRWFDLATLPALGRLCAALEAHPAMQAAALAEGLGATPLTAPRLPQEVSA